MRRRERESLTYQTNTSDADSFSLISYSYRKISEPDPDRFYPLFSSVAYPFSYPFFVSRLLFSQEYTIVIENKNFSEKTLLFSDLLLSFFPRTELLLTMRPTWSAGVFSYTALSSFLRLQTNYPASVPLHSPRHTSGRRRSLLGVASAVMRDAHV